MCHIFQVLLQAQREFLMYSDTGISVLGECRRDKARLLVSPCALVFVVFSIAVALFCVHSSRVSGGLFPSKSHYIQLCCPSAQTRNESSVIGLQQNPQQNQESPARAAVSASLPLLFLQPCCEFM